MGTFDHDTAVRARPDEPGVYDCAIDESWWVVAGPNGGYLAAIVVRALGERFGSTERPLRSLTVHYLRAPVAGPASVAIEPDREGRSVTFARIVMTQDGRPFATAAAVLARSRESIELADVDVPVVAPANAIEMPPELPPSAPPFARHFDFRPAVESGGGEAVTGGWFRLRGEHALDQPLVTALCDSWFPAVFAFVGRPMAVPTLDLTVHLRAPLPLPAQWVLGRFRTRVIGDGLLEEDAELFSAQGRLLAQARQLALAR